MPTKKGRQTDETIIKNNVSWIGKIDYVIANRAEHSGALCELMSRIPGAAYCRTS